MRFIIALFYIFASLPSFALINVYSETTSQQSLERRIEITWNNTGAKNIEITKENGRVIEREYSSDGQCVYQKLIQENHEIVFSVVGDSIKYKQRDDLKKMEGKIEKGGKLFFGSIERAAQYLIKNHLTSLEFLSIQPDRPDKVSTMSLSVEGLQTLDRVSVQKIKISLAGMMSVFWSAHLWIDSEGLLRQYEGTRGPGTPNVVQKFLRSEDH